MSDGKRWGETVAAWPGTVAASAGRPAVGGVRPAWAPPGGGTAAAAFAPPRRSGDRPLATTRAKTMVDNFVDETAPPIEDPIGAARARRDWERSPTIGRLSPRGDARVSRVLARHHALELEVAHDEGLAEVAALVAMLARPAMSMRRATSEEYARGRVAARAAFARRPDDLWGASADYAGRNRSNPALATAALRFDPGHLVDDGIGLAGIAQVRCTALAASRSSVVCGWLPLPASWRQHAAERVLERSPHLAVGNVHLALGREVARVAPALSAMADAVRALDPNAQVAMPFAGGLLLGSVDVVQPGVATSAQLHAITTNGRSTGMTTSGADRLWASRLGMTRPATWTAMTYVSLEGCGPARRAYAEAFAALTAGMAVGMTAAFARDLSGSVLATLDEEGPGWEDRTPEEECGARIARDAARRTPRRERLDAAGTAREELGFDADAARGLALLALDEGIVGSVPQARDVCASVPVRRRDHDDDPFRRAMSALGAREERRRGR